MYGEGSNDIFQFYIFISCLKNVLSQITDLSSSNTSSSFILYDYTCVDIFSLVLSRNFFEFSSAQVQQFRKTFLFSLFSFVSCGKNVRGESQKAFCSWKLSFVKVHKCYFVFQPLYEKVFRIGLRFLQEINLKKGYFNLSEDNLSVLKIVFLILINICVRIVCFHMK